MVEEYWLKPTMIVLGIIIVVILLLEAMPQTFPNVQWSSINSTIIAISPWLVALGIGLFVLVYISGRK